MKSLKVAKVGTKGGAIRLTLNRDGEAVDSWEGKTLSPDRVLVPIANKIGVEKHWLRLCLDKGEGEYTIPEAVVEALVEAVVHVRGKSETEDKARSYPNIESALGDGALQSAEPLIFWDGLDRLCAVDADFHAFPYDKRPTVETLQGRLVSIAPAPSLCWVTHGRGLRLIYKAQGIYLANELAAVALARLLQLEPLATGELKSSTRHPLYPDADGRTCSAVDRREQSTDCRAITGWYEGRAEADSEDVKEWLEDHGYEIGARLTHDRCPVDPATPSHGVPVSVYDNGIFCYGCAGHGVRRGARSPGWFPYSVFLGNPSVSVISRCVENLVHWEHARFILAAHHRLPESVLRGAYSAMLKGKHGNDLRIPGVFQAGRDVVRYSRFWGTLEGESFKESRCDAIIAKLPATQYVGDGGLKIDGERVARLLQPTSLERYGYPHLRPVWGLPIYSQHNDPKYPYEIEMFKGPGLPPTYRRADQRISEVDAWARMQEAFPGINRNAIKLLIAAKGCAEADGTFPPFVFITGPTASAKSTSVVVAAAICGDRVHGIPSISDDQRIRAAISEAKNSGTFAVFNEAVKEGKKAKLGKAEMMEFVLGLTPDSVSHKMYVGPVEMGNLPVLVFTDTGLPQEVKEHGQLARRFVHVHLWTKVDWHASMRATGMGKAEWLRLGGRSYVEAADTILSCVIDEFFTSPATFEEIAKKLGFGLLSDSDAAKMQEQELIQFHELVTAAPEQDGWHVIEMNDGNALAHAWRELADKPDYRMSQRCSEVDWMRLLGATNPVRFHVNCKGSKVRIKFEGGEQKVVAELPVASTSPDLSILPDFGGLNGFSGDGTGGRLREKERVESGVQVGDSSRLPEVCEAPEQQRGTGDAGTV